MACLGESKDMPSYTSEIVSFAPRIRIIIIEIARNSRKYGDSTAKRIESG